MIVDVLVELKLKKTDKTFSYLVPKCFEKNMKIGIRVLVPFGKQKLEGFILNISENKKVEYKLKEIIQIIDENPILNSELLEMGHYLSKKTLAPLITCYQTMLPTALKAKKGFSVNKKYIDYLLLNELVDIDKLNEKQKQIIELIKKNGKITKKEATEISLSSTNTLINKGIIILEKVEVYRLKSENLKNNNRVMLNEEQKNVVNSVLENRNDFAPYLLFGVTGSGKTEVYMNIIENVVNDGKKAIVLVPEISLTPQMVYNFQSRFGDNVAILHSRLSDGEKYDEWRKIEKNEVSIAIGARSAIFAPFENIGIIIIDEEHSENYKQENIPRYNAIDIAIYRSKKHNCPLLLGSATPSIESYTRAKTGIYKLLTMKKRVNNTLPEVTLIDMRDEIKKGYTVLSSLLIEKITEKILKKEQVIILLNRRGYSTVLTCSNCGYTEKCPNCDIPLTYHKTSNIMRCHYCGYGNKKLTICPNCKNDDINEFGMGTQKLQEFIEKKFCGVRTVRMDVDTTTKKGSHEKIINDFKNHEYDILIGTQMISKGLDFPLVSLVGVLNGDSSLNIPDFRSGERTFQLLNQIAGRAGRGNLKGEVIIQGFNIGHYSITTACEHNYEEFYDKEMELRKLLKYPPYFNICLIKLSSKNEEILNDEAMKIKNYLNSKLPQFIQVYGPNFSNIPKINNVYFMQIIIKYKKMLEISDCVNYINSKYNENNKINVEIDLSPIKI